MMDNDDLQREIRLVYHRLDDAISTAHQELLALEAIGEPRDPDCTCPSMEGMAVVNWVVAIGLVALDEDGDRQSMTSALVHGGDQPMYITEGLLTHASKAVQQQMER